MQTPSYCHAFSLVEKIWTAWCCQKKKYLACRDMWAIYRMTTARFHPFPHLMMKWRAFLNTPPWYTHLLNSLRKIPMFMFFLELRMVTWQRKKHWTVWIMFDKDHCFYVYYIIKINVNRLYYLLHPNIFHHLWTMNN